MSIRSKFIDSAGMIRRAVAAQLPDSAKRGFRSRRKNGAAISLESLEVRSLLTASLESVLSIAPTNGGRIQIDDSLHDTADNTYISGFVTFGSDTSTADLDTLNSYPDNRDLVTATNASSTPLADNGFIAKYNGAGGFEWVVSSTFIDRDNSGSWASSVISEIELGSDGKVYFAGQYSGSIAFGGAAVLKTSVAGSWGKDIVVGAVSPTGSVAWIRGSNVAHDEAAPRGLAVDVPRNRLYVVAVESTTIGYYNSVVTAYNFSVASNVTTDWRAGLISNAHSVARDAVIDTSGNLYIGGWFAGTIDFDPGSGRLNLSSGSTATTSTSGFLWKLSPSGTLGWAKSLALGKNSTYASITNLAWDPSQNLVAAGIFRGTVDFDFSKSTVNRTSAGGTDAFFAKYDQAGALITAAQYGTTGDDSVNGLAVDASGQVYLSGSRSVANSTNREGFLNRYTANTQATTALQWSARTYTFRGTNPNAVMSLNSAGKVSLFVTYSSLDLNGDGIPDLFPPNPADTGFGGLAWLVFA